MNMALVGSLWPQARSQVLAQAVLVALGVALMTAGAKVQVPMWPVPFTLQTLALLLIGGTYGFRLAGITLLSYLALGALGASVFARCGGFAYFVGSTGGYLLSYFVAAAVMGWLADRGFGKTLLSALAMFVIGEAIVFTFGVAWLSWFLAFLPEKASWVKNTAIYDGFLVFVPAEILKIALATALLHLGWKQAKSA
jgi:biotin transport system substrate-specific component